MESLKKIINERRQKAGQPIYAHHEFQDYGVYLSEILHDPKHKSLYIKLAKQKPRGLLEEAKGFAKDYNTKTVNRGKLFMWKLQQLENPAAAGEREQKEKPAT